MSDKHCPLIKAPCKDSCAWNIDGECAIAIIARENIVFFVPQYKPVSLGKSKLDESEDDHG
jgi:hypothetical protein